jgi:hypothetical protein
MVIHVRGGKEAIEDTKQLGAENKKENTTKERRKAKKSASGKSIQRQQEGRGK